jgi:hypothetical protein
MLRDVGPDPLTRSGGAEGERSDESDEEARPRENDLTDPAQAREKSCEVDAERQVRFGLSSGDGCKRRASGRRRDGND